MVPVSNIHLMHISAKGIELIKMFEGFESKAYPDPATGARPYTIGFGTTRYPDGREVQLGDTCMPEQAEVWLRDYLQRIDAKITVELNDNQWGAVASFIYNLGIGSWLTSTLRWKINKNSADPSIKQEFMRWTKAAGKVMPGLVRRRRAEAELYFT